MIETGLREYLLSQTSVSGTIGHRIYMNRRPADVDSRQLSIVLDRLSAGRIYSLLGEVDAAQPIIRLSIVSDHPNASYKVYSLFEAVRLLISGFRGEWGDYEVLGCTFTTEGVDQFPPVDKSTDFTFSYGVDMRITHRQGEVANSPAPTLQRVYLLTDGSALQEADGTILTYEV